jgi:hypothetical protein
MSSTKSKKPEPSSDLSRQYRRIGIKAVAAAARNAQHSESEREKSERENEKLTKEENKDDEHQS